jgi:TonB family protein
MADCDPRSSPGVRFLRTDALTGDAPGWPIEGALGISVLTHALGFLLLALLISRLPADDHRSPDSTTPLAVVWLPQPGKPQGGGGSGDDELEPARAAQRRGRETLTVPAVDGESPRTDDSKMLQEIQIPAVPMMADARELPGVVATLSLASTDSQGPGTGDRGGSGNGDGSGPGDGPGLGPGWNGGRGGKAYQIGSGVIGPRLIVETKPAYTADAMRARIQGVVSLEAIVLPDGSVGRVRIIRSLDNTFGLDNEAVMAVKRWRFAPGTLAGRAVPVLVNVELAFTLR